MHMERALELDDALSDAVASDVEMLATLGASAIDSDGERMRPKSVLLSPWAAGRDEVFRVRCVAAALELLHTAALVHRGTAEAVRTALFRDNSWRCQPWMIAGVDPSGTVVHGC